MNLTLVGFADNKEFRFDLREGVHLIGRAEDAEFRLEQASVSRRHAEITVKGSHITVRDLGSHNGTVLNGARLSEPQPLAVGDTLEVAKVVFRVAGPAGLGLTMFNESGTLMPSAELSWDELQGDRRARSDLHSRLFRVLAEAGDLLTVPRAPEELFEPILNLIESALEPERTFIMLKDKGHDEPVAKASRVQGHRPGDSLALSRTMMKQVMDEKKSFLTSDPLNDPEMGGMMSMVSAGIRSAIAVPLFDNAEVIGLLYADDSRPNKRFTRDQLSAFTMLANVIAVAITHARYHALEEEKRRQDAQLKTASEILEHILPSKLPACAGYEATAHLIPCFEVGGDLYDAVPLPDGRYAFLLGDVSGKGLGAAILVSHILSWTRFMIEEGWDPLRLITKLNNQVFAVTDTVRFATFFLGYLDPQTGRVEYVNAGHNPPVVVRSNGAVETLGATGMPLGILEEFPYTAGETALAAGDLIAVYSDGVTETQRADDEEYGEQAFELLLVNERTETLSEIFVHLYRELLEFRGETPAGDDVTLLLLRRDPA